ncbi:thermonuclease family protein [Mesorhizobium sp. B2-3-14]|nr:thermonuclease family protein [Mesorhizobium sp. B2-7-3]TPK73884.1 thermonuclease family protein [Mesorhizobium sp. B2-4-18]TPL74096.1 thermonuclease family protein [Mesorhizobium sp. B2-3-15]TPL79296.1 thermonuclease family protein [Mesorhizobium sp. B2-3-14]TPL99735.1 thermonuclease family protein [Mesorhizobium sp. B2-3-10]
MTARHLLWALTALACSCLPSPSPGADIARAAGSGQSGEPASLTAGRSSKAIAGRASVIDGRTLWFPRSAQKVRLAGIDSCELPQWAFDAKRRGESAVLKPVPCGALAKAWLKRMVGDRQVVCLLGEFPDRDGALKGRCVADGHDLAVEMLRVGWARVETGSPVHSHYLKWQRYAMSARYGMWSTYVLDMDEWRAKAIDSSLARRPVADSNLIAERKYEITPPFVDARRRASSSVR